MRKIFLFIIISILIISCKKKPDNLIPRDEFIDILVELHIYDAIMNRESFVDKNITSNDSLSYYNYFYKKHGITREDFKQNIEYYSEDIKDFNLMYDEVVAKLDLKKIEVDSSDIEDVIVIDSTNLWYKKYQWNLPADGKEEAIKYEISTTKQGTYTLSAEIKMYPDDGTINQRMSIYAHYTDGTYDGNSNGTMAKDGNWKSYTVSVKTNKNKVLEFVSGWVLDHSEGTANKHSEVKDIRLEYSAD